MAKERHSTLDAFWTQLNWFYIDVSSSWKKGWKVISKKNYEHYDVVLLKQKKYKNCEKSNFYKKSCNSFS